MNRTRALVVANGKGPRPSRLPPRAVFHRSISLLLTATVCVACAEPSARTLRDERMKMGTRFEIQLVSADEAAGRAAIDAAYAEIEACLGRVDERRLVLDADESSQRYFERDGVRYHHIPDPATGRPARRSVAVTLLAPTALAADALATGLFVLGPERGIELVEQLDGIDALIFEPDLTVHRSSGFPSISPNASD